MNEPLPELESLHNGRWFSNPLLETQHGSTSQAPPPALGNTVHSLIAVINFLGPFAAGTWLLKEGYYDAAGVGVGLAVVMPLLWYVLAYRPAKSVARRNGAHPSIAAGFFSGCWQYGVLAAWTLFVFAFLVNKAEPTAETIMLVWGYGIIMAPMSFLTRGRGEAGREGAAVLGVGLALYMTTAFGYSLGLPMENIIYLLSAVVVVGAMVATAVIGGPSDRRDQAMSDMHMLADQNTLNRNLNHALSSGGGNGSVGFEDDDLYEDELDLEDVDEDEVDLEDEYEYEYEYEYVEDDDD